MEPQYRRVQDHECWQNRVGPTPCYRAMEKVGVKCSLLCPVALADEQDPEVAAVKLHKGICLMDEYNSVALGAIVRARRDGSALSYPREYTDSLTTEGLR